MKRHNQIKPLSIRRSERKSRNRLIFTLILGIFLIYALFSWILPTIIGGASLINNFKQKPTQEVENKETQAIAPPVLSIPYEATNTATIRIKGYAQPNLEVEIYVDDDLKSTAKAGDDGNFTSEEITLSLGTNNINGKTIGLDGSKSLSSKPIKIYFNNQKPKLDIKQPSDSQEIKGGDKKVNVSGNVDPPQDIIVTINNSRVILDQNGNFSQTIEINEGENNIMISATDSFGNNTKVTKKITYQPS